MHNPYFVYIFQVVWKPLAIELARRGHEVTFFGPYPDKTLESTQGIDYQHIRSKLGMQDLINSSHIFEGNKMMDFSGFLEAAVAVSQVPVMLVPGLP